MAESDAGANLRSEFIRIMKGLASFTPEALVRADDKNYNFAKGQELFERIHALAALAATCDWKVPATVFQGTHEALLKLFNVVKRIHEFNPVSVEAPSAQINILRRMKGFARTVARGIAVLVLSLTAETVTAQWAQWPVSQGGNGHWYQVFRTPSPVSWAIARAKATQDGGYLASITTPEENAFVFNLIRPVHYFSDLGPLIGGYQLDGSAEPAGGWTWVTGEPWTYTNWAASQPDNGNGGIEAGLHFWIGSTWNDAPTNTAVFVSYVVERPALPRPSPLLHIRFSEVEISWNTVTDVAYRVEYRSVLTTSVWTQLGTNMIIGNGERHTLYERLPANDQQRFYRIVDTSDNNPDP